MQTFNRLELPAKFQTLSSNAVYMDVDAAPSTATCTTPPQPHFSSEAQLGAAVRHSMEDNSMPLKPIPATSSEPQMSVDTLWHPYHGAVECTPAEEHALTKLCDDQEAQNWPLIALHLAQLKAEVS